MRGRRFVVLAARDQTTLHKLEQDELPITSNRQPIVRFTERYVCQVDRRKAQERRVRECPIRGGRQAATALGYRISLGR